MRADSLSVWLGRAMLAIFLVVCAAALALGVTQERAYTQAFLLGLVWVAAALWLLRPLCRLTAELGRVRIWIALTVLCLAVKGAWVLLVQVPVSGDYAVFWGYAQSLARSETIDGGRYVALFPHIFGYASFLSWFIRVLGPLPMLAQTLNVINRYTYSFAGGALVGPAWPGFPPICSGLPVPPDYVQQPGAVRAVVYHPDFAVSAAGHLPDPVERSPRPVLRGVLWGVAAGLLLRWINGLRPIAAILLIASFLWVLLLRSGKLKDGGTRRLFLPFLAVRQWYIWSPALCGTPILPGGSGRRPPPRPGYSVLVGFNPASGGRWNQQDSDTLFGYSDHAGATPSRPRRRPWRTPRPASPQARWTLPSCSGKKSASFWARTTLCGVQLRRTAAYRAVFQGLQQLLLRYWCCPWPAPSRCGGGGLGPAALLAPLYVLV